MWNPKFMNPLHHHHHHHHHHHPLHTEMKVELTFTFVTETFVVVYFKITEMLNAMIHDN